MKRLYIDGVESINEICKKNNIPEVTGNISIELKKILNNNILVFKNGFGNLSKSLLISIFTEVTAPKVLIQNNQLKLLVGNNINELNNIKFAKEEIAVNHRKIALRNCTGESINFINCNDPDSVIEVIGTKKINNIIFQDCTNAPKIKISLPDEEIQKLAFKNFQTENILDINIMKVEKFIIQSSYFESNRISFTNLEVTDKFILKNSSLGEMSLNGMVITSLFLKNSNITSVFFNAVRFPDDNLLLEREDTRRKTLDASMLKDNYRQLKITMEKNGNYTEANKFYANEMNYHMIDLDISNFSLENAVVSFFSDGKTKKLGDKISLVFSSYISYFGERWLQAFFNLIIFVLYANFFATAYIWLAIKMHSKSILEYEFGINCIHYYIGYPASSIDFNNYLILSGIWIFLLVIGIIFVFVYFEGKFSRLSSISDYILFNKKEFLHFFFVILIFIIFFSSQSSIEYKINDTHNYVFNSWKNFFYFLYPLYGLKFENIKNMLTMELAFFTIFKLFYSIILWHLIVAAKRTTKR